MVRAVLAGRKTQTRREVKPQPPSAEDVLHRAGIGYSWISSGPNHEHHYVAGPVWAVRELMGAEPELVCPYGKPGDRLWVRETWGTWDQGFDTAEESEFIVYRADDDRPEPKRWRPSIHMPREACRLLLEITAVRIEPLHSISYEDAVAEGVYRPPGLREWMTGDEGTCHATPKDAFRRLWAGTGGVWDRNPWVWVLEFQQVEARHD